MITFNPFTANFDFVNPSAFQTPWTSNINGGGFALSNATGNISMWTNDSGYLTSLSGALLATGATTGATSQAQAFTNGVITGKIYPSADSTTAFGIFKANGTTNVLDVDTTNGFIGIGLTPLYKFHLTGTSGSPSLSTVAGIFAIDGSSTAQLTVGSLASSPYSLWIQTKDNQGGGGSGASYPLAINPLGGQLLVPVGSVIAGQNPGLAFNGITTTGLAANDDGAGHGNIAIWEHGTIALNLTTQLKEFRIPSDFKFAFASSTNNNTASDTSFSRDSAGVLRTAGAFLVDGNVGIGTTSPSGLLTVSKNNSNYNLATLSDSHVVLENPTGSQEMLAFSFGGVARGGIRGDSGGNFNWHATGSQGHQFYSTLDASGPILGMSASGLEIGGAAGATSAAKLSVNGNAAIGYAVSQTAPSNGLLINGNVGIGTTSPTAILHLKAGTATAGTAPQKFTAGTLLTTPELGALEFVDDGTNGHLYITRNIAGVLTRTLIV